MEAHAPYEYTATRRRSWNRKHHMARAGVPRGPIRRRAHEFTLMLLGISTVYPIYYYYLEREIRRSVYLADHPGRIAVLTSSSEQREKRLNSFTMVEKFREFLRTNEFLLRIKIQLYARIYRYNLFPLIRIFRILLGNRINYANFNSNRCRN